VDPDIVVQMGDGELRRPPRLHDSRGMTLVTIAVLATIAGLDREGARSGLAPLLFLI
jgi:hypothetical protein